MTDEPVDPAGACRPERIAAITLFAEDLQASRDFYQRLLDLPVVFEDAESFVVDVGGTLVNVLTAGAAGELVAPATVGGSGGGPRCVLTIAVDDVDAAVERLRLRDVTLLNGPTTRPWGPRTASVRDPSGHLWELAS
jgi:lactoylglutathione lyase